MFKKRKGLVPSFIFCALFLPRHALTIRIHNTCACIYARYTYSHREADASQDALPHQQQQQQWQHQLPPPRHCPGSAPAQGKALHAHLQTHPPRMHGAHGCTHRRHARRARHARHARLHARTAARTHGTHHHACTARTTTHARHARMSARTHCPLATTNGSRAKGPNNHYPSKYKFSLMSLEKGQLLSNVLCLSNS